MKMQNNAIWRKTGFKIEHGYGLFIFEDLNPHVKFKQVFSKWERFKIGLWFIWQVFK